MSISNTIVIFINNNHVFTLQFTKNVEHFFINHKANEFKKNFNAW